MALLAKCGLLDFHKGVSEEEKELRSELNRPFHHSNPADLTLLPKPDEESLKPVKVQFLKGTTTLAFKFSEGILVAVDSRASAGQYIASQTVKKVIEINPYLLGTMAGGAADCSYWERYLARECRLYALRNGQRISVAAASKILSHITYYFRNYGLSMGTMIAGYDEQPLGAGLYYVNDQGVRVSGDQFSIGSGCLYAYGIMQAGLERTKRQMTIEQAEELGKKAIYHATYRDTGSGGVVNVYYMGPDGWRFLSQTDVSSLHDRYSAAERPRLQ